MNNYFEQHKNDPQSVASLIYFRDGISLGEAERIIRELENKNLIHSHTTREYNEAWGSPVWYIP